MKTTTNTTTTSAVSSGPTTGAPSASTPLSSSSLRGMSTRSPPSTPIRTSATTTSNKQQHVNNSSTNTGNTMAHRLRILQLQHPIPTSMTLTAAMQLLLDHYDYVAPSNNLTTSSSTKPPQQPQQKQQTKINNLNISVYLMDRHYLQNWLLWAWHQTVPPAEIQRTKEALHLAATQLGLFVPPYVSSISNGGNHRNENGGSTSSRYSYTDPGPINNTVLSLEGHPTILDYNVRVGNPKSSSSQYSTSVPNTNAIALRKILSANSAIPSSSFSKKDNSTITNSNKMRMIGINSDNITNRTSRTNYLDKNAIKDDLDIIDNYEVADIDESDDNMKQCVAVPESFYETLRQVHGVICDDYCAISFQPHPVVTDHHYGDDERIVLQHHVYYNSQSTRSMVSSQQTASTVSRPIEFRRKVIRQIDYDLIHQQHRTQIETTSTLMEKLLIEEQRQKGIIPMTLAIEVYPIKLVYTIQNETDSPASAVTKSSESLNSAKSQLQPHGFVLVSSTASVVDAFTAVMRVTEPTKTSQSVRIWTKWNYEYGNNTTELSSSGINGSIYTSRPTRLGDGYELVDMDRLASRKKLTNERNSNRNHMDGISSPQSVLSTSTNYSIFDDEKMTIGEWAQAHYPPNSNQLASQQQHQHHYLKEMHLIVETRRTVNSLWPRESLKLVNRLQPGDFIDAQDVAGKWYEAVVKSVDADYFVVHYAGWASKWDAKVPREYKKKHNRSHSRNGKTDFTQSKPIQNGGHSPIPPSIQYDASKRSPNLGSSVPPKESSPSATISMKVKPPAALWSHSNRWREQLQVGDILEVRDSSSLAERPKWYRGVVKKISSPNDSIHEMSGGADLEEYSVHEEPIGNDDNDVSSDISEVDQNGFHKEKMNGAGLKSYHSHDISEARTDDDADITMMTTLTASATTKTAPLILFHRTQQILVEVEQERSGNDKFNASMMINNDTDGIEIQTNEENLTPQPPFRRWVHLYGEEVCQYGTHLKMDIASLIGERTAPPVTLTYELESNRKPVEIMKSHPMHGSGFMRESLRGVPPAPGSVGLHNLGNSCFLNSTVQCLNHIKPLTQYFLDDRYVKDLNKSNPLGSGGNVSIAYASLLKKIWAGNHSILVPRMLKQTVASFAPQFDNSYQHDSHEFCQFLMDGIHEDLNRVKKKPYVDELEAFGMKDQIAAIESWRKHLLRHDSIIVDHCQGMHRSHLTCPQCGRESIKFDVYSSISLPLAIEKNTTSIELEDCIEKFMEAEQLDERDAYYCPSCRRHVCALKLIALWTVPDILILHLKRFTFDTCMSSGSMLRSKIDNTVKFPIDGLDLTKQVLGPVDPDAPPIYNLFGVSEHIGPTANSGHYTATIRNSVDGQWYRCNDSHVGRTSGEATITGGAYLLFYQRAKGLSKWGGLAKAMKELNINPYGGNLYLHDESNFHPPSSHTSSTTSGVAPSVNKDASPVPVDKEGFTQVKKKKTTTK